MLLRIYLIVWLAIAALSFAQSPISVGQQLVIHSKVLHEDRTVQIALPESYSWALDRSYPVLYVLDSESNFLHTSASAGFLSMHGEIPEMIVVGITSTVRIRDYTQTDWSPHWFGGGGAKNFQNFLRTELMPGIEKKFRTNGYRILAGHSAAGQFTLYCVSSYPELYNAYFAISPSLDWDDNLPRRSLEESFKRTDTLRSFLYVAYSDDAGQALAEDMKLTQVLEMHAPKRFRWSQKAFPAETHISVPLVATIDALRQLFAGYRLHDDSLANGMAFAEKHFAAVSELVGYNIPVPEDIINNLAYEALDKGAIEEAIALFTQNIRQNPNSANAYDSMSDGYKKAGQWQKALEACRRAITLAKKYKNLNLQYFAEHFKRLQEQQKNQPK